MGAAMDLITARIAAGENVTPADFAEAEAADRLAVLQADADRSRADRDAETARLAAIEDKVAVMAVEVDELSEKLELAFTTAVTAFDDCERLQNELDGLVAARASELVKLGVPVNLDNVIERTGGRVIYVRPQDMCDPLRRTIRLDANWVAWRHRQLAERAERAASVEG